MRSYRVMRQLDHPDHVMIDLEFDTSEEAETFHDRLRDLWDRIDVIRDPTGRIAEVVDARDYASSQPG